MMLWMIQSIPTKFQIEAGTIKRKHKIHEKRMNELNSGVNDDGDGARKQNANDDGKNK